ncbi:RNA polymerase subunit sigma-70 [Actinomadura sp. 1N219]|uniref:RNA polymerase subunit sigma-70 n=1 Tax=Actinomadura sp. 1N219 TaxID=3375152 RepID=UPI0037B8CA7E
MTHQVKESADPAEARSGGGAAFAELANRYRPELQLHCYRMLGSLEDAEDLVQETLLRAWRKRMSFEGRSALRTWLYRIATNLCLDYLERMPPARQKATAADPGGATPPATSIRWLQPFPDQILDDLVSSEATPDMVVVAKETIELAFMVAIQHLPPRQRAVLILRDVLGWSAKDTAAQLGGTVASVNSALQRARPVLKRRLPEHRLEWQGTTDVSEDERQVLQRYMAAIERADSAALAAVLRKDARAGQRAGAGGHTGPEPLWVEGRDAIITAWAPLLQHTHDAELRLRPTRSNRQPAVATYLRMSGDDRLEAFALTVLRIDGGGVAEVATFAPDTFPAFGLPSTL